MLKRRAVAIGILNSGIVEPSHDITGAKAVMQLTTGVSLSFQNHAVLPVLQVCSWKNTQLNIFHCFSIIFLFPQCLVQSCFAMAEDQTARDKVLKVVKLWRERSVFDEPSMLAIEAQMTSPPQLPQLLPQPTMIQVYFDGFHNMMVLFFHRVIRFFALLRCHCPCCNTEAVLPFIHIRLKHISTQHIIRHQ